MDRGVCDDLPDLVALAQNPFRSEAEAYRFLLLTIGFFALIVAAAALNTWLGLGVFVLLTVLVVWRWLGSRTQEPLQRSSVAHRGGEDERRILVIANETVGGSELLDVLRLRA